MMTILPIEISGRDTVNQTPFAEHLQAPHPIGINRIDRGAARHGVKSKGVKDYMYFVAPTRIERGGDRIPLRQQERAGKLYHE
jgi:hypothetical protein